MKLIATLPEAKYYRPLPSNREGRWLFEDRDTSMLRIMSPDPSPWGKRWKLVFQRQDQKADRSQYPYRLNIKLFPVDGENIATASMERESVKALYAWADYQPLAFYAFPTQGRQWVFYSFYRI